MQGVSKCHRAGHSYWPWDRPFAEQASAGSMTALSSDSCAAQQLQQLQSPAKKQRGRGSSERQLQTRSSSRLVVVRRGCQRPCGI